MYVVVSTNSFRSFSSKNMVDLAETENLQNKITFLTTNRVKLRSHDHTSEVDFFSTETFPTCFSKESLPNVLHPHGANHLLQ